MADKAPKPNPEELKTCYAAACGSRILEEHIVRLASRGEVKFANWGPGEEVHGSATALALSHVVKDVSKFGIVPHYRSGSLVATWASLHGYTGFSLDVLRQQFSKDTDQMSRGRQMVNHLDIPELGILPVQSPVGMQLGKAAGYALGFKMRGIRVRDEAQPLQPGEFRDVDAPGGDLNSAFMPLPYKGPNQTLLQIRS